MYKLPAASQSKMSYMTWFYVCIVFFLKIKTTLFYSGVTTTEEHFKHERVMFWEKGAMNKQLINDTQVNSKPVVMF